MSTQDSIRGHELFRSLSIDETHRLSEFSHTRSFEADQMVFECGQVGTHIYMLMRGAVNLRLPASGEDFNIVVSRVGVGELFGLSPLMDSPRYTTAAQCVEPSDVLSIEAKPLQELLRQNSPVALDVLNRVARIYFARYLEVLRSLQSVVNQIPLIR